MCLICVEYQKGQMTVTEAFRALGEMGPSIGFKHFNEVRDLIVEGASKEYEELREAVRDNGYGELTTDEDGGVIPPDDTASD